MFKRFKLNTAVMYGNDHAIGDSINILYHKYELAREDIFITSKLDPSDMGFYRAQNGIKKCLENLETDYVDLFLINFPACSQFPPTDPVHKALRNESWLALINMYNAGQARAIGVSNFTVRHLNELREFISISPMVNQVEWHPYYFDPELLSYCQAHDIALQAYSSFGGLSSGDASLIEEPLVKNLAQRYSISPAQVLLQWAVQREIAVIPKSITPDNIKTNSNLNVKMEEIDLVRLDNLNISKKYAWDPDYVC